jgi:hypothetical protein
MSPIPSDDGNTLVNIAQDQLQHAHFDNVNLETVSLLFNWSSIISIKVIYNMYKLIHIYLFSKL